MPDTRQHVSATSLHDENPSPQEFLPLPTATVASGFVEETKKEPGALLPPLQKESP